MRKKKRLRQYSTKPINLRTQRRIYRMRISVVTGSRGIRESNLTEIDLNLLAQITLRILM